MTYGHFLTLLEDGETDPDFYADVLSRFPNSEDDLAHALKQHVEQHGFSILPEVIIGLVGAAVEARNEAREKKVPRIDRLVAIERRVEVLEKKISEVTE